MPLLGGFVFWGKWVFWFLGGSRVVFVLLRIFIVVFFGFLIETPISGESQFES